jgi:hypothetical protein
VRVVAYIPDLLFGSSVLEGLRAAGHEPVLVTNADGLDRELPGARVLVVDLTADSEDRIEIARRASSASVPMLGFYSHVESEVRAQALGAGFDLVVPRSRMAREGVALVERLSGRS